ncbi:MAG: hypothetical protein WHT29_05035 [Bacteroidales bacterium]
MKRACIAPNTNLCENQFTYLFANDSEHVTCEFHAAKSAKYRPNIIKTLKKYLQMKNNVLLIALLLITTATAGWSQKYARNQFVVFSYTADIDDRVKKELSAYQNLINYQPQKKQTAVEAVLIHSFYQIFTKLLEDSLLIYFLPPESMGNKVSYTDYGYPDVVIQKAIRLSDVKYFMKIELSIENSKYDERGNRLTADVFLPVVNVSVSIYNKFGFNPIQTAEGQSVASAPIQVKESFLAGLNFVSPNIKAGANEETMKVLLERCAFNALYSIKYKKIK